MASFSLLVLLLGSALVYGAPDPQLVSELEGDISFAHVLNEDIQKNDYQEEDNYDDDDYDEDDYDDDYYEDDYSLSLYLQSIINLEKSKLHQEQEHLSRRLMRLQH